MPKLTSAVDPLSPAFKALYSHNTALSTALRDRVAKAAQGGAEASRQRHVARGKLLPRDRVERLLDPGSPFLEIGQLAANGMYGNASEPDGAPGAGMICGIGRVSGREVLIVANDPTVKGGAYLGATRMNELKGPPGPAKAEPQALDTAAAARLWEATESMLDVRFA